MNRMFVEYLILTFFKFQKLNINNRAKAFITLW